LPETILITGILGQDGAYLAKLAIEAGHRVVGGARRSSTMNDWRLRELEINGAVEMVDLELLEESNIYNCIATTRPDRIFNLAAQSFVGASFNQPLFTGNVDALGVLRILEAVRAINPKIRFYQASTSEMFGKVLAVPQNEETPFYPRSPYGVAKVFGHFITKNYREAYGMHASSGILFNHESPLRGEEFVTRKITSALARIEQGSDEVLELGNLDAKRDWGHARDYVRGMWLMTEQEAGDDYVLATGVTTTIRRFLELAAIAFGFAPRFDGDGTAESVYDANTGRLIARVNPKFYRPTEVELLVGDASKANAALGWKANVTLEQLVREMVEADRRRVASA
jgi:GDPmannose 4,6-dehydratase